MSRGFKHIILSAVCVMMIFSGLGFSELHKIPTLIKHYETHRQESMNQLGFIDFLVMHYNDTSKHRHEENHEDLPLFHSCCSMVLYIVEQPVLLGERTDKPIMVVTGNTHNHYELELKLSVFQPPRLI